MSKKVEPTQLTDPEPMLGDWNGHSFHAIGKRCLIFLNSKTCYSMLVSNVLKRKLGDFSTFFRESLIQQLNYDFSLPEGREVLIRQQLSKLRISGTNNHRNVIGTMNEPAFARDSSLHGPIRRTG